MSLKNSDIREALAQLGEAVQRADKALAESDDLPPLDLAEVMVETSKFSAKLTKLADRVERLSAPLFAGTNGQTDTEPSERPNRRRNRRES